MSFVFLSQIEPDSYVQYPVMEHDGTDKEGSRRKERGVGLVLLHKQAFPFLPYFQFVAERSNYLTG